MSETGFEKRVGGFRGIIANLPDADAIIHSAGVQPLAVGAERDGVLLLERLRKSIAPLAARDVPKLDGAVGAGAGEDFTIGPKRQAKHRAVVARERFDFLARLDIPQFDLLIVAAGRQCPAVRRDR